MKKSSETESTSLYSSGCELQDDLSAYIDKELPVWKRQLIRWHLKKCTVCADHVQQLRRIDNFLRAAGAVKIADTFLHEVMVRVPVIAQYQRQQRSFRPQAERCVQTISNWIRPLSTLTSQVRYKIRTHSPAYIFTLTFAVFAMMGLALYPSSKDRFVERADVTEKKRLISFEVVQREPPKRLLTDYLQPK